MSVLCHGHLKQHNREKSLDGRVYSSKKVIVLQIIASTPKSFTVATSVHVFFVTFYSYFAVSEQLYRFIFLKSSVLNFFNYFCQLFSLYLFSFVFRT